MLPFDLHVLSMPPAFNLSQDQTLQFFPNTAITSCLISSTTFLLSKYRRFKAPSLFVFSQFLISSPHRRVAYSTHPTSHVNLFLKLSTILFTKPADRLYNIAYQSINVVAMFKHSISLQYDAYPLESHTLHFSPI